MPFLQPNQQSQSIEGKFHSFMTNRIMTAALGMPANKRCCTAETVHWQSNCIQTIPQIAAIICNNIQMLALSHHLYLLLDDLEVIT